MPTQFRVRQRWLIRSTSCSMILETQAIRLPITEHSRAFQDSSGTLTQGSGIGPLVTYQLPNPVSAGDVAVINPAVLADHGLPLDTISNPDGSFLIPASRLPWASSATVCGLSRSAQDKVYNRTCSFISAPVERRTSPAVLRRVLYIGQLLRIGGPWHGGAGWLGRLYLPFQPWDL